MAKISRLICDRCGFELTDRDDIELALEGMNAWHDGQRSRGEEPRGLFPCKFYFQCHGEMIVVDRQGRKVFV